MESHLIDMSPLDTADGRVSIPIPPLNVGLNFGGAGTVSSSQSVPQLNTRSTVPPIGKTALGNQQLAPTSATNDIRAMEFSSRSSSAGQKTKSDVPSLNAPGSNICENLRSDPVHAPRFEHMDVRDIHVSANIFGISGISTTTHSFACDFYLILHWELSKAEVSRVATIERLGGLQGVEEVRKYWGSSAVFTPAIEFENARDLKLVLPDNEFRRYPRLDKDNPQYVKYTLQYRAVFRADFDLRLFPFDSQQLQILIKIRRPYQLNETVRAIRSTLRRCKFNVNTVERTDFLMLPNPEFLAGRKGDVSKFAVSLCIQRHWSRYIVECALSHFSLSLVAWAALLFTPPALFEFRTQVLLTLVLVSLAFKFVSAAALPQVAVITALETYAHFMWLMLLAMLIYVQVIGAVATAGAGADAGTGAGTVASSLGGGVGATPSAVAYSDYAEAPWAFSRKSSDYTRDAERWCLITLACVWFLLHTYVACFVMGGLKRFAQQRLRNAQQFGAGTFFGGGGGTVYTDDGDGLEGDGDYVDATGAVVALADTGGDGEVGSTGRKSGRQELVRTLSGRGFKKAKGKGDEQGATPGPRASEQGPRSIEVRSLR